MRKSSKQGLAVCHPNAAGIDIGSTKHYVAVPADRSKDVVRSFGALLRICMNYCDGFKNVRLTLWQWNPLQCIGFRCLGCLKRME